MVRVDEATERVSVQEYKRVLDSGTPHLTCGCSGKRTV